MKYHYWRSWEFREGLVKRIRQVISGSEEERCPDKQALQLEVTLFNAAKDKESYLESMDNLVMQLRKEKEAQRKTADGAEDGTDRTGTPTLPPPAQGGATSATASTVIQEEPPAPVDNLQPRHGDGDGATASHAVNIEEEPPAPVDLDNLHPQPPVIVSIQSLATERIVTPTPTDPDETQEPSSSQDMKYAYPTFTIDDDVTRVTNPTEMIASLHSSSAGLADVTFYLGQDQVPVEGHRIFFAHKSPVFRYDLYESPKLQFNAKGCQFIKYVNYDLHAFLILKKFVYYQDLNFDFTSNSKTTLELFKLAEHFALEELSSKCKSGINNGINGGCESVLKLLQHLTDIEGNYFHLTSFVTKAVESAVSHGMLLLENQELLKLSRNALRLIFESDRLAVEELQVLNAAKRWAETRIRERDSKEDIKLGPAIARELGDLIYTIRFPVMPREVYVPNVLFSKILTLEQRDKINTYKMALSENRGNDPEANPAPFCIHARDDPPPPPNPQGIRANSPDGFENGVDSTSETQNQNQRDESDLNAASDAVMPPPAPKPKRRSENNLDLPAAKRPNFNSGGDHDRSENNDNQMDNTTAANQDESGLGVSLNGSNLPPIEMDIDIGEEVPHSSTSHPDPIRRAIQIPQAPGSDISQFSQISQSSSQSQRLPAGPFLSSEAVDYILQNSQRGGQNLESLYAQYVSNRDAISVENCNPVVITGNELFDLSNCLEMPNLRNFSIDFLYFCKDAKEFKNYLKSLIVSHHLLFFRFELDDNPIDERSPLGLWMNPDDREINIRINGLTILKMEHQGESHCLTMSGIADSASSILQGLPLGKPLTELHLDNISINSAALKEIVTSRLVVLTLDQVKAPNLSAFLINCKNLKHLRIDNIGDFLLINLADLAQLRSLALSKVRLIGDGARGNGRLKSLTLKDCRVAYKTIDRIPQLFPGLQRVKISRKVRVQTVLKFLEITTLQKLSVWELEWPKIDEKSPTKRQSYDKECSEKMRQFLRNIVGNPMGMRFFIGDLRNAFILEKPGGLEDSPWESQILDGPVVRQEVFRRMDFEEFNSKQFYSDEQFRAKMHAK